MKKTLKEVVRRGRNEERRVYTHKQLTLVSLQIWHQCSSFPSHSASEAVWWGLGTGLARKGSL